MREFDYIVIVAKQYRDHKEVMHGRRIPGRAMALLQELINIHRDVSLRPENYEPENFKDDWRKWRQVKLQPGEEPKGQ